MIIDDKLFIHRPTGIEKSKTPVCDFVYRDKAGAKFYTALSKKQREILWEFLGRVHSRFDFEGLTSDLNIQNTTLIKNISHQSYQEIG